MSLKSSNKVDTNRYQLEVQVDADAFEMCIRDRKLTVLCRTWHECLNN